MKALAEEPVIHDHSPEAVRHGSAVRANVEGLFAPDELGPIVDMLTQNSLYTPDALDQLDQSGGVFSIEDMRRKAGKLIKVLDGVIAASGIDGVQKQAIDQAFTENGLDTDALKNLGINAEYTAGITQLIAALLHGKPPIDIETVGPYACEHLAADGTLQIDEQNIPNNERIGIELSVLFRQLADASESPVRIVTLLDELNNYREGNLATKRFTPEEQDQYVAVMAEYFGQKGIIHPDDQMGSKVLLLRETDQVDHVPELIERLGRSSSGSLTRSGQDGSQTITFMPSEEFVDSLGLHSKGRRQEFKKKGIVLQEQGRPLCQALDASAFLGEENKHIIHLVMLDHDMASQQDKVFAILKALDIVQSESYHNIFTDSSSITPDLAVYTIARLFSTELKRLQSTAAQPFIQYPASHTNQKSAA